MGAFNLFLIASIYYLLIFFVMNDSFEAAQSFIKLFLNGFIYLDSFSKFYSHWNTINLFPLPSCLSAPLLHGSIQSLTKILDYCR